MIAISDTTVAIGIAGTVCSWLGVLVVCAVAALLKHPADNEEQNNKTLEDDRMKYTFALPGMFLLTVFGTISSLYVFCVGSQDPGSLFFWASLSGTSLMLFAQMLLLSNCQRLEITQAVGSFSIACVVSIQFITALGVQGGDFNAHPLPDMMFVMGGGISGTQKAVAWISPLLTLIGFAILIGGRIIDHLDDKDDPESGSNLLGKQGKRVVAALKEDTISASPVTRALILFFFTLAAIGNVFVLSFITSSGNATAISFGLFGVLLNIAVLFNAIGSKPLLDKAGLDAVAQMVTAIELDNRGKQTGQK